MSTKVAWGRHASVGRPDEVDRRLLLSDGWHLRARLRPLWRRTCSADNTLRAERWAPWDVCCEYVDFVESKAIPEGVARIDIETLRRADESTRETWNDLMKHEGLTLGEVILRGKVDCSPFWLFAGNLVHSAVEPSTPPPNKRKLGDDLAPEVSDSPRKVTASGVHPASRVAKETSRGKKICPDHNTNSCVSAQGMCKHEAAHVCNYILDNGEVCMSPSHKRCEAHH